MDVAEGIDNLLPGGHVVQHTVHAGHVNVAHQRFLDGIAPSEEVARSATETGLVEHALRQIATVNIGESFL